MSNIKSERAKVEINAHTMGYDCSTIRRDSVMVHEEYAINAVILAEKDAEERAIIALFKALNTEEMECMPDRFRLRLPILFKQFLNDGGQDNE